MKEVLLVIVVIGLLLTGSVPAVWAGPLEEAVQLTDQWLKLFHEGNAEALSALYASDAVYTPWTGPFPVKGREAIKATFAGYFQVFPTRRLVFNEISRKVYGDTVISYYSCTLMYGDASKGIIKTVYGRNSSVAIVVGGRRVIVDHFTSLIPIGGP